MSLKSVPYRFFNPVQHVSVISRISAFLLGIVLIFIYSDNITARDYYVRPIEGEYGIEDGTSYETAFDGFEGINWNLVKHGNGKLFVCGTFSEEQLSIPVSGDKNNPVQLVSCTKAYDASANDPGIIDGVGKVPAESFTGLVDGQKISYIIVDGLEIKNSASHLVEFNSCTHITIKLRNSR